MIKDINQLDLSKRYTYADYLTWQFDEMVELIRGKVFRMAPAPGVSHQSSSGELHRQISNHLLDHPCRAFAAPFDVRLPLPPHHQEGEKVTTVVQPDISVVCDPSLLDERGCQGPPDWIIEILSKATAHKDLHEKFEIYQHAGVREYWIVHPDEGTVLPYRRDEEGRFQLLRQTPFATGEKVPVGVFPGLEVDLALVFR
jgi:Uma2 family endonuclease